MNSCAAYPPMPTLPQVTFGMLGRSWFSHTGAPQGRGAWNLREGGKL